MTPNQNGRILVSYVAHLLHILAQIYLGMLVILALPPIIFFARSIAQRFSDGGVEELSFGGLLQSFALHWGNLPSSLGQVVLLLIVAYAVGFVTSECAYRFGILVGYHDDFSPEKDDEASDTHYSFRSALLRYPHLQKLWDWEQLQFHLCYYSEIVLALVSLALGLSLIAYYLLLGISLGLGRFDAWVLLVLVVLSTSLFVWLLGRSARATQPENLGAAKQVRLVLAPFSVPLAVPLVAHGLAYALGRARPIDGWLAVALVAFVFVVFLWFLMQIGRKSKQKSFHEAHTTIKQELKRQEPQDGE